MKLGVREIEGPAEHVAELVMERHADRAEHAAAEPCTVKRLAARIEVGGVFHYAWKTRGESADTLFGHQRHNWIGVLGVKRFDAMRDRVHAAGGRQADRHRQRKRRIVDDSLRKNIKVA